MKTKIERKQIEIASKYSTNDEQFIDNMRILQEFLYEVNNILIEDIYKEISNKIFAIFILSITFIVIVFVYVIGICNY